MLQRFFYVDQVFDSSILRRNKASSLNRCLTFVSLSVQVPYKDQKCHVNLVYPTERFFCKILKILPQKFGYQKKLRKNNISVE